MSVPTSLLDERFEPVSHDVDERWLMAYAAAVGETGAGFFDTERTIVGHPLFSVALEWEAIVRARRRFIEAGMTPGEVARGVHATHDVRCARPIRPGMRPITCLRVVSLVQRTFGTFMVCRLTTTDEEGRELAVADHGFAYLGVDLAGHDQPGDVDPVEIAPVDEQTSTDATTIPIAAGAAHVYTECARIWNPIHTDIEFARNAGLDDIILHGSATLAMTLSSIGVARPPSRIRARFTSMVTMPQTLTARWRGDAAGWTATVMLETGESALHCRVDL